MRDQRLVLHSLQLVNFATFKDQRIVFDPGFNAIVGETGSGKSLVLDAIQLIFGSKSEKRNVRKDSEFSTIEASFISHSEVIKKFFDDIGHPFHENEIVIKRIIYPNGRSKSFINHSSCAISTLQQISTEFIDLVGQFENQKLLSDYYQLMLIDQFAGIERERTQYEIEYRALKKYETDLADLKTTELHATQRSDYLQFQIQQLHELNPSIEKEEQLLSRKNILSQIEKRTSTLQDAIQILSEAEEQNVYSMLKLVQKQILNAKTIMPETIVNQVKDVCDSVEALTFDLSKLLNDEFNQEEYDAVLEELDKYQKLKRKFGGETKDLVDLLLQFKTELETLHKGTEAIASLTAQISQLERSLHSQAVKLHEFRIKACRDLSAQLTTQVQSLRMKGAELVFLARTKETLSLTGITNIDFMASTNPGEGFHHVKNIASGGELSRILLALRKIVSATDSISIFLFDEIDAGIGGKTALSIGETLSNVAQNSQVLTITHLPQIAKFSNKIIHIAKLSSDSDGGIRTFSEVTIVDSHLKEKFLAEMTPLRMNVDESERQ